MNGSDLLPHVDLDPQVLYGAIEVQLGIRAAAPGADSILWHCWHFEG